MRSAPGLRWTKIWFLSLLVLCGCSGPGHSDASPDEIRLSGTPGAAVSGYYICNSKRIELRGTLPITLREGGIIQLAVRKANAADRLEVAVRREHGTASTSSPAGDGDGLRLDLSAGMMVTRIGPKESLSPPANSLTVIAPYWYDGTWVFDDANMGLSREPFVSGMPEMINVLAKDIPGARDGFRLTFSDRSFPGYQKKLRWVRAESGGNFYRMADPPMEGWLCPALFRYFTRAPKELYFKAEPGAR